MFTEGTSVYRGALIPQLLEEEQKLKWKLLVNNVKRVAELVSTIMATWETIKGFWTWKNKAQSLFAFCVSPPPV